MEKVKTEIPTSETGSLGVLHLKRYWNNKLRSFAGEEVSKVPKDINLDRILLQDLGLGFAEQNQFFYENRPTYDEFERWIVNQLGGAIRQEVIARTNDRISRFLAEPKNCKPYPLSTTIADPILSAEDMAFWEENGYVVLRAAIPTEDALATEMAIWEYAGQNPHDTDSWDKGEHNFWVPIYHHPALQKNRESVRIKKAFAQIWGTENLVCEINRASINFPEEGNGNNRSGPSRLHWDTSLALPMSFDVLGILYLTDTEAEQGAFRCIPGFHHQIEGWLQNLPPNLNPREEILKESGSAIPVTGKAGDLIICRQELPHSSSPNRKTYPRICQYISMFPPDFGVNPVWK